MNIKQWMLTAAFTLTLVGCGEASLLAATLDKPSDSTLAMVAEDFQRGQNPHSDSTESGSWSYHASVARNPMASPEKVTLMGWDAGMANSKVPPHFEEGPANDDGKRKWPDVISEAERFLVAPGEDKKCLAG